MAKAKNKRKADKVQAKKTGGVTKKKVNPFEVHINREKLKVLGKKSKHDRGLPGVSRAKAVQKRKETLGMEMKLMHKTNAFIDRRIGEKDSLLSAEDRMVARFAAERAKQHSKKNIYNLADDEILTHRGQTLEQIEKFDDPRSSDEDEEVLGGLDGDFVSEGHFGGGMLAKSESSDGAKTHKELIEQLIAESKKRKAEKQKEKEQTLDLTEKLDSEWKDLQPVVFKRQTEKEESIIDKVLATAETGQDYDKMMRELRFEKRGTPSDGLKSVEKQQEEERKKIEELEKKRDQRMMPDDVLTVDTTKKHRSADDLDDNFELDDDKEFMLAYDKSGKPLVPEHVLKDYSVPNGKKQFEDGISDSSSDDESDDNDDNSGDEKNDDDSNEAQENGDESGESGEENESNDSESDAENDDETSNHKDGNKIKNKKNESHMETESESDEDTERKRKNDDRTLSKASIDDKKRTKRERESSDDDEDQELNYDVKKTSKNKKNKIKHENFNSVTETSEEDDEDGKETAVKEDKTKKHVTAKYLKEKMYVDSGSEDEETNVPYNTKKSDNIADLPGTKKSFEANMKPFTDLEPDIKSFFDSETDEMDKLRKILNGLSPSHQYAIIEKLKKAYDPSQSESNKENLSRLFGHLLQYSKDILTDATSECELLTAFRTFDKIVPHLYDLAHLNKVSSKKYIIDLLTLKYNEFKRCTKRVPDLDTLMLFKLVSLLYPTSDFRHPVTTPSFVFLSEILTLSRFNDRHSISRGLLLTSIVLQFTILSKRLVPAAINFLRGILFMCANTSIVTPIKVVPPFRTHRDMKVLNLDRDCTGMVVNHKMRIRDLVMEGIDDDFKVRCFWVSALITRDFFMYYNDMEAQAAIFEPHIQLLERVDLDLYPGQVKESVRRLLMEMKLVLETKTFTPLANEKPRPKALRLYEPDVQEVFTGSKSGKLTREKAEQARLQGKYKKEMKGALREIRRDKDYIGSVQIRQKLKSDMVRKEKVKQIYKEAAIQQGELNKLKRSK